MSNPAPSLTSADRAEAAPVSSRLATVLLAVFVAAAAVRLVATEVETSVPLGQYANYALVSSLAAWVLARRGPGLVAVALGFGWVGDILLYGGDDLRFLLGMGAFGVGHLCWASPTASSRSTSRAGPTGRTTTCA